MHTLVMIRHGQSLWNRENRFTGWADIDLSEQGRTEAREAGELLKREGYMFDVAHTSVLKRASKASSRIFSVASTTPKANGSKRACIST